MTPNSLHGQSVSRHWIAFTAFRARSRWVRSVPGRDAYVYRIRRFCWEVRYIDYDPASARDVVYTPLPTREWGHG